MKIALLTVCTDTYPMIYARKLITRFRELSDYDVAAYCVTDRPDEISDIATVIEPPFGPGKGWWNKLVAYKNEIPENYIVYLDIDTVLIKNFDNEIGESIRKLNNNWSVACVSDAINWKNNMYSSSMMVLKHDAMEDVFDTFQEHPQYDYDGGDQVYTGHLIKKLGKKVFYIDHVYPSVKLNLKFHLGQKIFNEWKFPSYLPPDCKIVDCGGRPKPHELEHLSYIKENWHDVE
jgi:hypothetical protein